MKSRFASMAANISKSEQKNIKAGLMDDTRYKSCSCVGSTGSWTYTTPGGVSRDVAARDVKDYCVSGVGTCERA